MVLMELRMRVRKRDRVTQGKTVKMVMEVVLKRSRELLEKTVRMDFMGIMVEMGEMEGMELLQATYLLLLTGSSIQIKSKLF